MKNVLHKFISYITKVYCIKKEDKDILAILSYFRSQKNIRKMALAALVKVNNSCQYFPALLDKKFCHDFFAKFHSKLINKTKCFYNS